MPVQIRLSHEHDDRIMGNGYTLDGHSLNHGGLLEVWKY